MQLNVLTATSLSVMSEHVNEIARAHWGDAFPEEGVGKQWMHHFVSDYHGELGAYWSHPMDSARAWAINPITKEEYFDILQEVTGDEDEDDGMTTLSLSACMLLMSQAFRVGLVRKSGFLELQGRKLSTSSAVETERISLPL
jgi:hypothetical protein